jgi:hypothetical protein
MDMRDKKVLFIGLNYDQIPYLKEIINRGYTVCGTDMNVNAPGAKFCHDFLASPYQIENLEEFLSFGYKNEFTSFDFVFTASSQFAHLLASSFANFFNIKYPTKNSIEVCLDKHAFYNLFLKNNVPIPKTFYVEDYYQLRSITKSDLDKNKYYYIKSDCSKNPNYVYRVNSLGINDLKINWIKDRYFKKYYIVQEEFIGITLRVNIYGDQFNIFDFEKSQLTHQYSPDLKRLGVIDCLKRIIKLFNFELWLVKFDVIISSNSYCVLDIGIDPPSRMLNYCLANNVNFYSHYVNHYLDGVINYTEVFNQN